MDKIKENKERLMDMETTVSGMRGDWDMKTKLRPEVLTKLKLIQKLLGETVEEMDQ